MATSQDLVGKVFGRLTVLEVIAKKSTHGDIRVRCRCICGQISTPLAHNVKAGMTSSCGCLRKESYKDRTIVMKKLPDKIDPELKKRHKALMSKISPQKIRCRVG